MAQERTYVVKAGDSLSKIAKEVYGDAARWPEIFEANKDKIKDPDAIRPGQELRIPTAEAPAAGKVQAEAGRQAGAAQMAPTREEIKSRRDKGEMDAV